MIDISTPEGKAVIQAHHLMVYIELQARKLSSSDPEIRLAGFELAKQGIEELRELAYEKFADNCPALEYAINGYGGAIARLFYKDIYLCGPDRCSICGSLLSPSPWILDGVADTALPYCLQCISSLDEDQFLQSSEGFGTDSI